MSAFGREVTVSGLALTGGNAAQSYGGAIDVINTDLTIRNSTISGNSAGSGGAIGTVPAKYAGGGSIEIEDSTIAGNSATNQGGGLSLGFAGDATIRNSTISGNSTHGGGGGITGGYVGSIEIENSTVSGNSADSSGGGIYSKVQTAIQDSTIAGNSAGGQGGGIFAYGAETSVVNTIFANDSAGGGGPDVASPHNDFRAAFSLIEDPAGVLIDTTVPGSNITGVDPQLGELSDNGGPTQTQALPPSSPAVDAGSSDLDRDQRGLPRPVDRLNPDSTAGGANSADIGAVELEKTPPVDARAPVFGLSGDERQHSKSKVSVDVTCDEACSVDATGTINVPKSKERKKFNLLTDSAELGAGETTTLKLKFKSKVSKLVKDALKNDKKSTARVSATAADAAGNVSADDIKVTVKREGQK